MGVRTVRRPSVAALTGEYLDAVTRGEGAAAAERYFHPARLHRQRASLAGHTGRPPGAVDSSFARHFRGSGCTADLDEVRAFRFALHSSLDWSRPAGREARIAFSALVEGREGKIARYQFLENTFDVSLAFRSDRSWTFETDGKSTTVPTER